MPPPELKPRSYRGGLGTILFQLGGGSKGGLEAVGQRPPACWVPGMGMRPLGTRQGVAEGLFSSQISTIPAPDDTQPLEDSGVSVC